MCEPPLQRGRGDDVLPGPHDGRDREVHRGLSAGGGDGPDPTFERGPPVSSSTAVVGLVMREYTWPGRSALNSAAAWSESRNT